MALAAAVAALEPVLHVEGLHRVGELLALAARRCSVRCLILLILVRSGVHWYLFPRPRDLEAPSLRRRRRHPQAAAKRAHLPLPALRRVHLLPHSPTGIVEALCLEDDVPRRLHHGVAAAAVLDPLLQLIGLLRVLLL